MSVPENSLGSDAWGIKSEWLTDLPQEYWASRTYVPDVFDAIAEKLGVSRQTAIAGGLGLLAIVLIKAIK
jgi:hypothetical protein